ncbi:MAG: hypothetical protein RIF34_00880, partial [Candidatus Kapaibacterium sp.]
NENDEPTGEYVFTYYGAYKKPFGFNSGTVVFSSGDADQTSSGRFPGGSTYKSITGLGTWDLSSSLNKVTVTELASDGWVEFGYNMTEIDNCEMCSKFAEVIENVATEMASEVPPDWQIALKLTASIAKHIKSGFFSLITEDDHWAEGGINFRRTDGLWGTKNTMYKEVEGELITKTPNKNTLMYRLLLRH